MDDGGCRRQHRGPVSLSTGRQYDGRGAETAIVNSPCIALWAACGKVMRRQLDDVRTRRIFDGSMSLLVAATAVWIAWPVLVTVASGLRAP
jgi:threonine/homoserine/homoserine lactone efflux protein